jgi:hypothetical protein
MKGFYITGIKGSYIELEDGRWADTVSEDNGENRNVEELLEELTEAEAEPTYSNLSLEELKEYVGA